MNDSKERTYPKTIQLGSNSIEIRYMTASDGDAVSNFAKRLPPHDLLFLRRDITHKKVLDAWLKEIEGGNLRTLLAFKQNDVVGCGAIFRDELSWSPHVGELRIVVAAEMRGQGLGRELSQECFATGLGLGLKKLVANMTVDQRGAIAVFEGLGFRPEALLRDHVIDRNGVAHDVVVLSHDVAKFRAQAEAYGMTSAF